jgi:hypothetical protein
MTSNLAIRRSICSAVATESVPPHIITSQTYRQVSHRYQQAHSAGSMRFDHYPTCSVSSPSLERTCGCASEESTVCVNASPASDERSLSK